MNERLAGRHILVTGGASGLGEATVRRLAGEGARVAIGDIDAGRGSALAGELGGIFIQLDIAEEADWQAAVGRILEEWGGLDGLVNNAGILTTEGGWDVETLLADEVNRIFGVNVTGTILGCKAMIPLMAKSGGGSIVNLSSIAALVPTDFLLAYGASKAAVRHVTKSVALHCANKGYAIRCNSVHPGNVLTDMMHHIVATKAAEFGVPTIEMEEAFLTKIPLGKWQEPSDIAAAVVFLLSDEARYVTGTKVVVDGGMTLSN